MNTRIHGKQHHLTIDMQNTVVIRGGLLTTGKKSKFRRVWGK